MIAKLTGRVDSTGADFAVIDVGGVGYLVFCSARTLGNLGAAGAAVSLLIDTHVREDHIHLYGFADPGERTWFRLLTTVQGVGTKVALAVLSVLGPEQLVRAIAAQDRHALSRADGVGPKLALRILTELKDKAAGLMLGPPPRPGNPVTEPPPGVSGAAVDAVSALVNLGYGRSEAFGAVTAAGRSAGEAATVQDLIRLGLKELAPKELRS
ncbi:MAG: Holliday junction branch migration protein RuvA [Azospirillum sp.]|nr:Holliday junction branch migration protein RuvA [Azospirillum sp.]